MALPIGLLAQGATSPTGSQYSIETELGELRFGVSELESDDFSDRKQGVGEIGYVIRGEYGNLNPKSIAIAPFVRSHFEGEEGDHDYNTRSGVGVDLEFSEPDSDTSLVFRLTADEPHPYYSSDEDEAISTGAAVFVRRLFGGIDEERKVSERIRRLIEPVVIPFKTSKSFLRLHPSPGVRKKLHYLIMSMYIVEVRQKKKENKISDYDPFLDIHSTTDDREQWLYEHFGDRYPLVFMVETDSSFHSYSARFGINENSDFLSPSPLIQDFIESLENQRN